MTMNNKIYEGCNSEDRIKLDDALKLEREGLYDKALEIYLDVVNTNKQIPYAYASIGCIYYDKGDFRNAILYLRKAVELNETKINTWKLLIEVEEKEGQINQAEKDYIRCIELFPTEKLFYADLGLIYEFKKMDSKALEIYQTLLDKFGADEIIQKRIYNLK